MSERRKLPPIRVDATSANEPVILMERTFDAPRELVWEALTDPAQVAKWYGGHGFENPRCEMDVRPGGHWHHVMRTPDGAEHALEFIFLEVVRPEKLSWRSVGQGPRSLEGPHDVVMTISLEEVGARTHWKLVARFSSVAARDAAIGIGFAVFLSEGTEKFDDVLAALRR